MSKYDQKFQRERERGIKAFTLVELLIVIAIIAILAAITIPQFVGMLGRARDSVIKGEMRGLVTAIFMYKMDHGNLTGFCATDAMRDVRATIVGTGIDAADIICIDSADFVIMSSALHAHGAYWVVDSGGRNSLGPSLKGLVGYWRFDRNANDSSGLGNDGTLLPAASPPTFVDGALSFDGVNDYVNVPVSPSLQNFTQLSLELWMYPTAAGDGGWRSIIGTEIWGNGRFTVHTSPTHPSSLSFAIQNDAGVRTSLGYLNAMPVLNAWYHVVTTWDGNNMFLFVNGVQLAYRSKSGTVAGNRIRIAQSSNDFKGLIDEVRIYNRALSAAEIKAQFEAGR